MSGARERSFSTSFPVRALLLSSSHLPKVTSVTIIAADSKKRCPPLPETATARLYKKDAAAPNVTRVSILGTSLTAAMTPLAKKR